MNIVSQFFEGIDFGAARETLGRTITEADIVLHAGQTGDFYPHLLAKEWCKTQVFGGRVARGGLQPTGRDGAGVPASLPCQASRRLGP
ncbi:MAG: hypothetical protein JSV66_05335 [Trueperaceae bacterium]|nr:MAG: hypothetical protein JSV66_05335 [Trueperaceae bacterium]